MNKKKILVIDDEPIIRRALKRALEQFITEMSIEVSMETDGNRGLRSILEIHPHVILLDFMMPGLNGIEILEKMKEQNIHIPVIFMTAYGDRETEIKLKNLPDVTFLTKPFEDIQKLISLVKSKLT